MPSSNLLKYLDTSVLCWLATSSKENIPNVSPKEIFSKFGDTIIIANIASPQSLKNIRENKNVCLSCIDILVQKGIQIKGRARIIEQSDSMFLEMKNILDQMTKGKFPYNSVTQVHIVSIKPILAPSYLLFPETREEDQIKNAITQYRLVNKRNID